MDNILRNLFEKNLWASNNLVGPGIQQPLHATAAWWKCEQKEHGEDLVQLNGGSESSKHMFIYHMFENVDENDF